MRHDGHFSSPLRWVVSCCFLVGELNFDLFLTSSNNLTATVESNAAIEKKIAAPNQYALRTWLAQKKDIPISHGPDHKASPHAYDKDVAYASIFQDLAMQAATNPPLDCDVLHPMRPQLLALRIVAYSIAIEHLEVVNSLLLGERMPFNFLHEHCIMALLPSTQYQVILIDKNGRRLADRAVTSLKHDGGKGVELPVDMCGT